MDGTRIRERKETRAEREKRKEEKDLGEKVDSTGVLGLFICKKRGSFGSLITN